MRPPVEHVRVSNKCKEMLVKIKRKTGIEHWNALCRLAMCKSFVEITPINASSESSDSAIDMDWKTFAGPYQAEFASLIMYKAYLDQVDITDKDNLALYLKNHIERGVLLLGNSDRLSSLAL